MLDRPDSSLDKLCAFEKAVFKRVDNMPSGLWKKVIIFLICALLVVIVLFMAMLSA